MPLVLTSGDGAGVETAARHHTRFSGGLVMGQILTLYTTPVVYLFFDKLRNIRRKAPEKGFVTVGD
nr:efflux RND transporter permease subunit [Streptomyces sp. HP-A2021]